MNGVAAIAIIGAGYLFVVYKVAIWILNKNEEFLARQVPKLEQLEIGLERLIELCGEEEE